MGTPSGSRNTNNCNRSGGERCRLRGGSAMADVPLASDVISLGMPVGVTGQLFASACEWLQSEATMASVVWACGSNGVAFRANRGRYFQEGRGGNGRKWRVVVWQVSRSAVWSGSESMLSGLQAAGSHCDWSAQYPGAPGRRARPRGALSAVCCRGAARTGGLEEHILHGIGGLTGPTQLG